jgi:hypothetical protein
MQADEIIAIDSSLISSNDCDYGSEIVTVERRERMRKDIERQTSEFLANGGVISEIPPGVSNTDIKTRTGGRVISINGSGARNPHLNAERIGKQVQKAEESEKCVYEYIRRNRLCEVRDIADGTDLSPYTIRKIVNRLLVRNEVTAIKDTRKRRGPYSAPKLFSVVEQ